MIRAWIVVADFAESDPGGKVHVLGAGWSVTGPQPGPQAIVGFVQVPPERAGAPVPFVLRLVDSAGQPVEVQGPEGMQPLELGGQVEMQEPEGWDGSTELNAAFAVNVVLPLSPGETYTWYLDIDGKEHASTRFHVRSVQPAQPQ